MIIKDYLDLITSEHRDKPNYAAMVSSGVSLLIRIQDLMKGMIPAFDLDTAAGVQLDIIGLWVGVTRNVSIPISGIYFTWDGSDFTGWDYGTWRPTDAPATITTLPDDAYKTLIRAKIAANQWDGTTEGAYAIWSAVFPTFTILIQDNQNMSYALILIGGIVDSLTLALLTGGYIPLRPEGVQVTGYYVATEAGPAFCWDTESEFLAGWDEGIWLREVAPT